MVLSSFWRPSGRFNDKRTQALLHRFAFGHVDESDHHAVDLVVYRAIRSHPQLAPAAVSTANLAHSRGQLVDYHACVINEVLILELVGKIGNWPAFVARGNAEQLPHLFGESLDIEP